MDIELLVNELQYEMREKGYVTEALYTFDSGGGIVAFEIKIVGRID